MKSIEAFLASAEKQVEDQRQQLHSTKDQLAIPREQIEAKKKELEKKEESLAQYEQSGYDIGVKEIEDALGLRSQESAVGIVFRYGLKH